MLLRPSFTSSLHSSPSFSLLMRFPSQISQCSFKTSRDRARRRGSSIITEIGEEAEEARFHGRARARSEQVEIFRDRGGIFRKSNRPIELHSPMERFFLARSSNGPSWQVRLLDCEISAKNRRPCSNWTPAFKGRNRQIATTRTLHSITKVLEKSLRNRCLDDPSDVCVARFSSTLIVSTLIDLKGNCFPLTSRRGTLLHSYSVR